MFKSSQDKSERDKLKEEKLWLDALFNNSPAGIVMADSDHQIINVNERFKEMFKYCLDDIKGENIDTVMNRGRAGAADKELSQKVLEGDKVRRTEAVRYDSDGNPIQVEVQGIPIEINGQIVGLYGIYQDITARKKREKQLKLTKFSLDNSALAVFQITPEGKFEYVNKKACQLLNYKRQELMGMKIPDVDPNYSREEVSRLWQRLKDEESLTFESCLKTSKGDTFPVEINSRYLKYQDKEYHFAFIQDISTRKRQEKRIKEQNKQLNREKNKIRKLHQTALRMNASQSEEEICEIVVQTAEELLNLNICDVALVKGKKLIPRAASSRVKSEESREMSVNEGLAGKTYRTGRTYNIGDITETSEIDFSDSPFRSVISIPLQNIGVFQAVSEEKNAFSREDQELAELLITHAATSLENLNSQKEIKYVSYHDSLTDLYNRNFLNEEMERLDTERQLPITIIHADVNALKLVNDTYGHESGDKLLVRTAEILENVCREEDIIARYGGDEFVVFLPKTEEEEAEGILDRITSALEETEVEMKGMSHLDTFPLSLALGLASKTSSEESIYQVLNRAEENMYKNKLTTSRRVKTRVLKRQLKNLSENSLETEQHANRMQKAARKLGKVIDLSPAELDRLSLLTSLHDIGKTVVSQEILRKPDPLPEEKWEKVKEHAATGYNIVSATEEFAHIGDEILSHHERWDGEGYPRGLSGREIPLLARIIALADAYEVMTSSLPPYSRDYSKAEALQEISNCAGSQFDPFLVDRFVEIMNTGQRE